MQQFYAMFLKRALYSWRNWKVMVAQFLVPLIFTVLALVVARSLPGSQITPQLRLALKQYGPTHVPVAVAVKAGPLATALAEMYTAQLPSQNAIAATNITGNKLTNKKINSSCLKIILTCGLSDQICQSTCYIIP